MKTMHWLVRIGLFTLILCLGTGAALFTSETRGLALADLSNAPVSAMTAASDSGFYAALQGNTGGIYRSDDGGFAWQRISAGPSAALSALAVHPLNPQILLAGTSDQAGRSGGSLWYSEDGGQTWDGSRFGLPVDANGRSPVVTVVTAAPDQPTMFYMGTEGHGLYRLDLRMGQLEAIGGASLPNLYVKDIVANPPASTLFAITTEGLYKIKGNSLEKLNSLPDAAVSLAVDPVNPKILYAGTVGYGAFRSIDGGANWTPVNAGLGAQPGLILRVSALAINPQRPQHLALATAFGVGSHLAGDAIYESIDAGASWNRVAKIDHVTNHLVIKGGAIYAATPNGLTRYGAPPAGPVAGFWQRVESLTSPSAPQVLILALTVLFAVWVLLARLTWVPGWLLKKAA